MKIRKKTACPTFRTPFFSQASPCGETEQWNWRAANEKVTNACSRTANTCHGIGSDYQSGTRLWNCRWKINASSDGYTGQFESLVQSRANWVRAQSSSSRPNQKWKILFLDFSFSKTLFSPRYPDAGLSLDRNGFKRTILSKIRSAEKSRRKKN